MKKAFFSFAVAAVAAFAMASCGGKKSEKAEAPAEGEQATEQTEAPAEPAKVETVGQVYDVVIPAGWESKQYVSEMIIKKGSKELNFKDNKGNIADWVAKLKAENKQEDLVAAGRTWQVYKNEYSYKVAYLTQVGEHVLRVGSNVEDATDAEVLSVLAAVRDYDINNYQNK